MAVGKIDVLYNLESCKGNEHTAPLNFGETSSHLTCFFVLLHSKYDSQSVVMSS